MCCKFSLFRAITEYRTKSIRREEPGLTAGHVLTRGATGRITEYKTPEQLRQQELVLDWLTCQSSSELLKHSSAHLFRKQIKDNPIVENSSQVLFRGRLREVDMQPAPEPKHFGPRPAEGTKPGRYNIEDNPVLYLSSSEQGVFYEFRREGKHIVDLFCQKYVLPSNELKIADFSLNSIDNFIRIVFDYAEYGTRNGKIDKNDYLFSQVVAQLVQDGGYDGMMVLGVWAPDSDHRYNNVVIFNHSNWEEWIDHQYQPKCIDHLLKQNQ